jgi:hypothetical protein
MLTDKQIEAFLAALRSYDGPGRTPDRRGIIVRTPNERYYNGPAGRYMDPPTPSFTERNLTTQDIREALEKVGK